VPSTRKTFPNRPSTAAASRFITSMLRDETVGGTLLLVAALAAMIWANFAYDSYTAVRETVVGPEALHLDLQLQTWAADGLLAVFFFVVGLELKRELVVGDLRKPADAALPVFAALCGMIGPAVVYLLVVRGEDGTTHGWAIPTATDIAFALAVLAVIGSSLPTALRAFLLTLAVADDLGAITVIAIFYTDDLAFAQLGGTAGLLALYAFLQLRRVRTRWVYLPLAFAAWALLHASGVHATIAGVALGLLTRVRLDPHERRSPAERIEHRVRPLSAGLCVPVFALMAAGVRVDADALAAIFDDVAAIGVMAGLVIGKTVGVFGGTYLAVRLTRAQLSEDLTWVDMFALAVLAGIGFTVSLLIGDLAFGDDPARTERVKAAVLIGSLIAATLASVLLRVRNAKYRRIAMEESRDDDADGTPDVYQR
jgi:NhaA family Na+:H+ antiporter